MQNIVNDGLVVYFFTASRFATNGHASAAIMKDSSRIFDPRATVLFSAIGFDDVDEYVGSYPNKFSDNSETNNIFSIPQQYEETLRDLPTIDNSDGVSTNIYAEFLNLTYFRNTCGLLNYGDLWIVFPFLTPTLDEVLSCKGFSSAKREDKYLWFCSDWKG